MLPRSLNHIAKSSTSCTKRISVSSLPALSRSFVHPSRTDRAAVIDPPIRTSSHPPGTFSILSSFTCPFFNPPFQHQAVPSNSTNHNTHNQTRLSTQSTSMPRSAFHPPTDDEKRSPESPFPQATTPMDPRVLDAMAPFFTDMYGNPHSRTHAYGWEAEHAVDEARRVSPPFFRPLLRA